MGLLFIPSWRAIGLRGALALAFGTGAFLWPSVSVSAMVLLFGIYALLDGTIAIVVGSRVRAADCGWLFPLEGLLGVALGLLAMVWIGAGTTAIAVLIGAWALVTGALEVLAAMRLRRDLPGEAFLAFGGAASIALGALLLFAPHAGSLVLVVLFGSYALVFGAAMIMVALQLRDHERRRHSSSHAHAC